MMSRLLAKTLSYRFVSVLATFGVGYAVTGSLATSVSVGGIDALIKLGLYAAHESLWERLPPAHVSLATS